MAINKNHLFDDLDGVKCAIVETNVSAERSAFLKNLLELNKFTVVILPSPPAKGTPPPAGTEGGSELPPPPPETFTVGVTDSTFNSINAIYGRLLKSPSGSTVTMAYWNQKEAISNDEIPYYDSDR